MKLRLTVAFLLLTFFGFAQTQEWGSYFSYTSVIDVAQSNNRVYAASESAMFSQNTTSGELKTITSVEGLKAEDITAIFYSTSTQRTLVGNSNGLLLVVNPDGSISTKVDIVQEATVSASIKKINSIYEYNGIAYLSCDFGIVLFNLTTLQFGDTYYIGPGGTPLAINQVTVHEGYIYAATGTNVMRANISSTHLIDYNEWTEVYGGGKWTGAVSYGGSLFLTSSWGIFFKIDNGNAINFAVLPLPAIDLREANGYLVATASNRVSVYDRNFQPVTQINTVGEPAIFTCATVAGSKVYIGTTEKGVFSVNMSNYTIQNITPNGPLRSNIFSLEKTPRALWAVYGGYNSYNTPDGARYGVSKYMPDTGWNNLPYSTVSRVGSTTKVIESISDIAVNPGDEKLAYFGSFGQGLLRMNDMVSEVLYDDTNTNNVLQNQQLDNNRSIRINGLTFDSSGALWMTNSRTASPLKVLRGTQWSSYSFADIVGATNTKNVEYRKMIIDRSGTKWIPTIDYGLIAFNDALSNKFIRVTSDSGLPSDYVTCLAIDNSNRLWIGTARGLRVIYSASRFETEDQLTASQIIILEDGVAQELMYEQTLTDIEVDGANNKWLGTSGAGAFLISPDGQETLYHFTKENSPLPSNDIKDIAIDNVTGEVFFATAKGMVSYKGTSTQGADDLSGVYVYPNPVRPNFTGDVKITNLTDSANVKITDIEGNLVYEATSEGGTVLWDTTAFGKYKVRSGVYMIFISTEDAAQTKVKKVMIVR